MTETNQTKLLVATRNPGKMVELRELLDGVPFQLTSLDDEGVADEAEETGATFEENARLKASFYASLTGLLTLADDSGLEVDALSGEPGVHSARYGGPGLSDEDRVELLLRNMKDVTWEKRAGRFRCVISILSPSQDLGMVTGVVEGIIEYEPKGDNGFGYDPVFYLPHLDKTTAELSLEEKNLLSHRGQAARKAAGLLKSMALTSQETSVRP